MTVLYISLSLFVATSVAIGLIELAHMSPYWIPMALEVLGFSMLFYSTVVLIIEARIAVLAVKQETSFILSIEKYHN